MRIGLVEDHRGCPRGTPASATAGASTEPRAVADAHGSAVGDAQLVEIGRGRGDTDVGGRDARSMATSAGQRLGRTSCASPRARAERPSSGSKFLLRQPAVRSKAQRSRPARWHPVGDRRVVETGVDRRQLGRSRPRICSCDSRPRLVTEGAARSTAMIQSARAVPGGVTFCASGLTRPSRLVKVPSTSVGPAAASTTSACAHGVVDEQVDRDDALDRWRAPRRASIGVGEVAERVGAEQHERGDATVGRCFEDAARVESTLRRAVAATAARSASRPASRLTRPGTRPGARPMSSAPCTLPRRNADKKRTPGTPAASARPRRRRRRRISASDARPRITVTGRRRSKGATRAVDDLRLDADTISVTSSGPARATATSAISPGAVIQAGSCAWGARLVLRGRELDDLHAVVDNRMAQAQVQRAQLFFGVGPEARMTTPPFAQASSMVARGKTAPLRPAGRRQAGSRRCRCR